MLIIGVNAIIFDNFSRIMKFILYLCEIMILEIYSIYFDIMRN